MREEFQRILAKTVKEQDPDLDETGLDLAIRYNQTGPYVKARVWGNIHPLKEVGSAHQ